jgi:hypothetical protein
LKNDEDKIKTLSEKRTIKEMKKAMCKKPNYKNNRAYISSVKFLKEPDGRESLNLQISSNLQPGKSCPRKDGQCTIKSTELFFILTLSGGDKRSELHVVPTSRPQTQDHRYKIIIPEIFTNVANYYAGGHFSKSEFKFNIFLLEGTNKKFKIWDRKKITITENNLTYAPSVSVHPCGAVKPLDSSDGFELQGESLIEYFTSLLQSKTASCMRAANLDSIQSSFTDSKKNEKNHNFYKAIFNPYIRYTNLWYDTSDEVLKKRDDTCKSYRNDRVMAALINYYTTNDMKAPDISADDVKRLVDNLDLAFYHPSAAFPDVPVDDIKEEAEGDSRKKAFETMWKFTQIMTKLIQTEYRNIESAKKDPNYNAVCSP